MDKVFGKYIIKKSDGTPVSDNAEYFVLRLDTDAAARRAALHYALMCEKYAPGLASGLRQCVTRHDPELVDEPQYKEPNVTGKMTPNEEIAIKWARAMDAEGQYFGWCRDCGGPVLSCEDYARCYGCGHESGLDMLPNRYISDGFG